MYGVELWLWLTFDPAGEVRRDGIGTGCVGLIAILRLRGCPMSLRSTTSPRVPDETARVARAAFPHGSVLLSLRDELVVRDHH